MTSKEKAAEILRIARAEIGVKERAGDADNPRIVEYHKTTTLPASLQSQDETSWCSSFVNWCVKQAGLKGTGSAAARSWLNWGKPVKEPYPGCIVVFSRGINPAQGHVAVVYSTNVSSVVVVGGNQSDKVSLATYPRARIVGVREPE